MFDMQINLKLPVAISVILSYISKANRFLFFYVIHFIHIILTGKQLHRVWLQNFCCLNNNTKAFHICLYIGLFIYVLYIGLFILWIRGSSIRHTSNAWFHFDIFYVKKITLHIRFWHVKIFQQYFLPFFQKLFTSEAHTVFFIWNVFAWNIIFHWQYANMKSIFLSGQCKSFFVFCFLNFVFWNQHDVLQIRHFFIGWLLLGMLSSVIFQYLR